MNRLSYRIQAVQKTCCVFEKDSTISFPEGNPALLCRQGLSMESQIPPLTP